MLEVSYADAETVVYYFFRQEFNIGVQAYAEHLDLSIRRLYIREKVLEPETRFFIQTPLSFCSSIANFK